MKLKLFLLSLGAVLLLFFNFTSNRNSTTSKENVCIQNNGKWVEGYSECEGITKTSCELNSGKYNECASYCRHETDLNKPCILLCVAVCTF